MDTGVSQRKVRNMVSKGKGLVDAGQAEVGNFLNDFRLHLLGLWLRRLIEDVGLIHDGKHHDGSWIRSCEWRGGGCRISKLSVSSRLSSVPCLPCPHAQTVISMLSE